jgi:hypothetical protein
MPIEIFSGSHCESIAASAYTNFSFFFFRQQQIPTLVHSGKAVSGAVEVAKELIAAQKAESLLGADAKEQKEACIRSGPKFSDERQLSPLALSLVAALNFIFPTF